ncbi:MAG: class I SAM-dependent methyltransferase [Oceanipulchritudo sp.]
MEQQPALTEQARAAWSSFLHPGSWALDATAGNGRDTAALAAAVSPGGRVFALDIQEDALRRTAALLEKQHLLDAVTLINGDHGKLRDYLPCAVRGRIDLACFNLGYLPGSDHALVTQPESTLSALQESLRLLAPAGALSVIAYRGHQGALEEARLVQAFFETLPAPWKCRQLVATGSDRRPGPVWFLASGAP